MLKIIAIVLIVLGWVMYIKNRFTKSDNASNNYKNIIFYGIDKIGNVSNKNEIKDHFISLNTVKNSETERVDAIYSLMDELDNINIYPGHEGFSLHFEESKYNGIIDVDLMPNSSETILDYKKLVNFRTQIIPKYYWYNSIINIKTQVYNIIKAKYGPSNKFDNLDPKLIEKSIILKDQLIKMGVNKKYIYHWFIEKSNFNYLISFYYSKGKFMRMMPYLSFAISEIYI